MKLIDKKAAKDFLSLLDETAEEFTFQTFPEKGINAGTPMILNGSIDQCFDTLAALNRKGSGVYVTVNETDGKGRKIENIKKVRAVWIEDDGGATPLDFDPHITVETSPDHYHHYFLTDGMPLDDFRSNQNAMVRKYGSDPNAKDMSRVLRLPGFLHQKNPTKPHLVQVIHSSGAPPEKYGEQSEFFRKLTEGKSRPLPPTGEQGAECLLQLVKDRNRLDADQIRLVFELSPDGYEQWIKVGMAVHCATDGGKTGLAQWKAWSSTSSKYDEKTCDNKWASFGKYSGDPVTFGSLFHEHRVSDGLVVVKKNDLPEKNHDFTTKLPDHIVDPGGIISMCMKEMVEQGCPDIPQYNLPVTLASIARSISGKARIAGLHPNLYVVKIGPTSSGKSTSDICMRKALKHLENFYGPNDFASGPALLRALENNPSPLIILDEVTRLFGGKRGVNPIQDEKKDVLMELHTQTGQRYEKVYANRKDAIVVSNPTVTLTGNATPVIFDTIQQEDFHTGFLQRIEFFCYDGPSLYRSKGAQTQSGEKLLKLFRDMLTLAPPSHGFENELTQGAEKRVYNTWSRQVTDDANNTDDEGQKGILSRRFDLSLKFAMIHHYSTHFGTDEVFTRIGTSSVEWGIDLASILAKWKIGVLSKKVTMGDFHKDCETFKSAVVAVTSTNRKRRPTFAALVNRRSVMKNWDKKRLDTIVGALVERGEIYVDDLKRSKAYYPGEPVA